MQQKGLSKALSSWLSAGFTYCCSISLLLMANPILADTFGQLSDTDQAAVARICLPVQYQQGTSAYRECVSLEISVRSNQPESAASTLSFDEQYAIRQICRLLANANDPAYQRCLNQQLNDLAQIPKTQLASFDNDEIHVLQKSCLDTQSSAGVKAYRQCINASARALQSRPQPNLEKLTLVERNALQLRCSAQHTAAVDYRQCLLDAPNVDVLANAAAPTESIAEITPEITPESTPQSSIDTNLLYDATINSEAVTDAESEAVTTIAEATSALTPAITEPLTQPLEALVQTLPVGLNIASDPIPAIDVSEPESSLESVTSVASELWTTLQSSVSGLDNMSRSIITAATALPVLLFGFWLLMRSREREPELEHFTQGERNSLANRSGPSQQRREQPVRDFDMLLDRTDSLNLSQQTLSQQADDMFGEIPAIHPQSANSGRLNSEEPTHSDNAEDSHPADQLGSTERAEFLAWLNQQPVGARQPLAIEFLIYWLAYGDERFESTMKEAIFQIREPDEHERIKRWVLMQDIYAFSDVVYWLQHNSNIAQRKQILNLLMALLINENALTPVQNTTLRFLGDAFGLGHEQLDAQFRQAYDHSMPPLPRVDKPKWWDRQQKDERRRWDARTVSLQNRDIQNRVKLGLPLGGEVREEEVVARFKRAAARCHPQHFDLLGSREQSLAKRQLEKFEFAKDSLLGISV